MHISSRAKALALVAALMVGGCGSDDTPGGSSTTSSPSASGSGASSPSAAAASPTPAARTVRVTAANARAALITIKDLPAGWSTSSDEDDDDDDNDCIGMLLKTPGPKAPENAFLKGETRSLAHAIRVAGDAKTVADRYATAPTKCAKYTDDDGNELRTREISFPQHGDQTVAFTLSGASIAGTFSVEVILVRYGNVLSRVIQAAFNGEPDTALTQQLVTIAEGRILG